MGSRGLSATSIALVCSVGTSVSAQTPDYETLAAELARLRSDVESLSSEIQQVRSDTRSTLRNISSQKTQLEAEVQREELRLRQIRQSLEEVKDQVRQSGELQRELEPAVQSAIDSLRGPIESGVPFKLEERLKELDKLSTDLRNDVIAPSNALARLWSVVEDELRLTRENGLYQQTIELNGESVLADVARVGMVMLYFRTPDERYGYAEKTGSGWTWTPYEDSSNSQKAEKYFDSLEQRVRVGFFELPPGLTKEMLP
jgi:hypothetical protein